MTNRLVQLLTAQSVHPEQSRIRKRHAKRGRAYRNENHGWRYSLSVLAIHRRIYDNAIHNLTRRKAGRYEW